MNGHFKRIHKRNGEIINEEQDPNKKRRGRPPGYIVQQKPKEKTLEEVNQNYIGAGNSTEEESDGGEQDDGFNEKVDEKEQESKKDASPERELTEGEEYLKQY